MKRSYKNKKIGLALGSGGWRGLAHIGVLKVLLENDIPIDYIAGSSAGALIGGMYDALQDINEVEKIALNIGYRDFFSALFDPSKKSGLLQGKKMIKFLQDRIGNKKIEDLAIPFCAVTTNLYTGQTSPIMKGNLAAAIRASGSIPFIFEPVTHQGEYYVDGGTSMPVPVKIVRKMGADIVIGVNLYNDMFPQSMPEFKEISGLTVAQMSHKLLLYNLSLNDVRSADIVISPKIPEADKDGLVKFIQNKETIKYGSQAARKALSDIKF